MVDSPSAEPSQPETAKGSAGTKKSNTTRKPSGTKRPSAASKPDSASSMDSPASRQRFAKALEEAKAGAQALGKEAQERAEAYRDKAVGQSSEWIDDAKEFGNQARDKAYTIANEGKARASEAVFGLGKLVADNAGTLDDKVGAKYGDYARTAARSIQDAAEKLDSKELVELGEDAKEFVRKSPGVAVAMAAAAGFVLARMFKKTDS